MAFKYKPKYFSEEEFYCCNRCNRGGLNEMDPVVLVIADVIRSECGFPLKVNSSIRCEAHNKEVGGASNSQHLLGKAIDLAPVSGSQEDIEILHDAADNVNISGGVGIYSWGSHIDSRSGKKARWKL